jgi:hypothetical protein
MAPKQQLLKKPSAAKKGVSKEPRAAKGPVATTSEKFKLSQFILWELGGYECSGTGVMGEMRGMQTNTQHVIACNFSGEQLPKLRH